MWQKKLLNIHGGLRLQLELIKVQVAFFMQFAQKGGKGYEYDII